MIKKYLCDLKAEEITERFNNGEFAYKDDGISFKLINGILCSFYCGNIMFVNDSINPPDSYFLEPEKIKLEVGKMYKTRNGKRCLFFYCDNDGMYHGAVDGLPVSCTWEEDGCCLYMNDNSSDIVS